LFAAATRERERNESTIFSSINLFGEGKRKKGEGKRKRKKEVGQREEGGKLFQYINPVSSEVPI
jgi:hypothetical protein